MSNVDHIEGAEEQQHEVWTMAAGGTEFSQCETCGWKSALYVGGKGARRDGEAHKQQPAQAVKGGA